MEKIELLGLLREGRYIAVQLLRVQLKVKINGYGHHKIMRLRSCKVATALEKGMGGGHQRKVTTKACCDLGHSFTVSIFND